MLTHQQAYLRTHLRQVATLFMSGLGVSGVAVDVEISSSEAPENVASKHKGWAAFKQTITKKINAATRVCMYVLSNRKESTIPCRAGRVM